MLWRLAFLSMHRLGVKAEAALICFKSVLQIAALAVVVPTGMINESISIHKTHRNFETKFSITDALAALDEPNMRQANTNNAIIYSSLLLL
jgi:hypothetical protein